MSKRSVAGQPWYEARKKDRADNPIKHAMINKDMNLRRLYGISLEQFNQMREAQSYRCAVCGRHESEIPIANRGRPRLDGSRAEGSALVVDHHHKSSRVRKLLCARCNHMIGHALESPEVLRSGAAYLEEVLANES
jgi:hypothetical protein